MGCSSSYMNATAVDSKGIGCKSCDIDLATMQVIKNGIGAVGKQALKQNLVVSFAMENLPNLDHLSKTDAFAVFYQI